MIPTGVENIPSELRELPRWLVWRKEARNGAETKIPYQTNGRHAKSTDPSTWTTFDEALEAFNRGGFTGLGFVLGDGIVGIDVDAIQVSVKGELPPEINDLIGLFPGAYIEWSPSARGLHLVGRGRLPEGAGHRFKWGGCDHVEVYDADRYFTVTARTGTFDIPRTLGDCTETLARLCSSNGSRPSPKAADRIWTIDDRPATLTDQRINDLCQADDKFRRTWTRTRDDLKDNTGSGYEMSLAALAVKHGLGRADAELLIHKWHQKHWVKSRWRARFKRTWEKAVDGRATGTKGHRDERPEIVANTGDLDGVTREAWNALVSTNEPKELFNFGGLPSRTERDGDDRLVPRVLTEDRMKHRLAKIGQWVKVDAKGARAPVHPHKDIVKNVLATPEPPLPPLDRVVEVPVFSAGGELLNSPGYHPQGRLIYAPPKGFSVPTVPPNPKLDDVCGAVDLIREELLGDFPLVGEPEMAHAVGLLLLVFAREMIDGPTPLHLIDKPCPGSGGTLLAQALHLVATGTSVSAMTEGRDSDEWRKRITATLRTNPTFVLIDNLKRELDSASLASVLTARIWEDRVMGLSENIRLRIKCAWVASGNNPSLSSEMTRRAVRIRLDAKVERPWLRDPQSFRHGDLLGWVTTHRGELVAAVLTLVQNWIARGKPAGRQVLGMYESWARVIGGILAAAGIHGFLDNLVEFYESADNQGGQLRALIAAWWETHGENPVTARELFSIAVSDDVSLDLGAGQDRSQQTVLGKLLARHRDGCFLVEGQDGKKLNVLLTHAGVLHQAKRWRLGRRMV